MEVPMAMHFLSDEELNKLRGGGRRGRGGRGQSPKDPYDLISQIEAEEKRLKEFKEKIIKDNEEKSKTKLSLSKGAIFWMMVATSPIVGISLALLSINMMSHLIHAAKNFN